jgi:iron complex outermembrane recepter protein
MKTFILFLIIATSSICFSQESEKERERENDSLIYEIEEMTITGTRTMKRIIDIPFSVFRVDKKELSYGKKVSAKDLLADVPGLFLQTRYGNRDLRVSLRGYGLRSNTGIRGIRILQDGIPELETEGETMLDAIDFTSLGGVEVAKGNISSLYANAPGGVINFLTDLYFPQHFITSTTQAGKFGMLQQGLKLGVKTNDYRFLLTYNYSNIEGYRQHSNEYQNLFNSVFESYIGKRATLTILGNYFRGLTKLPGALTKAEYDTDPMMAYADAVSQDFKRDQKKGRIGIRFKTFFGKGETNEFEVTAFGGVKSLEQTDLVDYTIYNSHSIGSFVRYRNKSKIANRDNDFSVGFDYTNQSAPITTFDNVNGIKGLTIKDQIDDYVTNWGFYFYDQLNLIKNKFDVLVSGRYDKFIYTRNILQFTGVLDTTRIFEQFTPKIAFNYKLTRSIALYASTGFGFDVPAIKELENFPYSTNNSVSLNPDLIPQKSFNFEFGIKGNILNKKSEFFRKIYFDATVFNYLISDDFAPFVINNKTYYRNAAKTNRTGFELGFKSEPFERVELAVNYIYTNFKFKEYTAVIYDPSGNRTEERYDNNFVPSIPQHTLNFILGYEYEIARNIEGLIQFDCDYLTKMYVDDKNSASTDAYFYANPMIGINFITKKFNILAYVGSNNVTDTRYVGFINVNDYNSRFYETGEPRNIYAGLKLSFKY